MREEGWFPVSVPNDQLKRVVSAAEAREAQGYFERARKGDKRACSLFARLVAGDLNITGNPNDFGWLSKQPGETQVDGYAEDAICFTADPANRQNVVDMIVGAGAPNATIGASVKERREKNLWVKPKLLTAEELDYLLDGGEPAPIPVPPPVGFPYPDENTTVKAYQGRVRQAYNDAGRPFPDPNDSDAFRHFTRYGYSCRSMPEPEAANKHIAELRADLGLPA